MAGTTIGKVAQWLFLFLDSVASALNSKLKSFSSNKFIKVTAAVVTANYSYSFIFISFDNRIGAVALVLYRIVHIELINFIEVITRVDKSSATIIKHNKILFR